MKGKNKSLYNPPLYKSSGILLEVATTTTLFLINTSNKDFKIIALAISVT